MYCLAPYTVPLGSTDLCRDSSDSIESNDIIDSNVSIDSIDGSDSIDISDSNYSNDSNDSNDRLTFAGTPPLTGRLGTGAASLGGWYWALN